MIHEIKIILLIWLVMLTASASAAQGRPEMSDFKQTQSSPNVIVSSSSQCDTVEVSQPSYDIPHIQPSEMPEVLVDGSMPALKPIKWKTNRSKLTVENSGRVETKNPSQTYPLLSVKTNLLYDAFFTPKTGIQPIPNVEVEFYMRNGRWSILTEVESPWWKNEKKLEFFQLQNVQLEPRFYFKKNHLFNGHYVGVYAMANLFDFALKGNKGSGVQGEGAGAGVTYGYVLPLGKKTSRWKMEFNIKAGYYESHYDPYDYEKNPLGEYKYYYRYYGDPNTFRKRNWRYRWVGPTGVGVTLSYDLIRGFKGLNKKK